VKVRGYRVSEPFCLFICEEELSLLGYLVMADSNVRSREARLDFDEDMLEGAAPVPGPSDEKPVFDDNTLKGEKNGF